MVEYHPYDTDSEYSDINSKSINEIVSAVDQREVFSFVWMGDTQRFYDETEELVDYINANLDIDFVLHGGDISDFGMRSEFEWVHEIMLGLNVPYVALIGNHDVLGTGHYLFKSMYGDDNFSFTVSDINFVCLNTNALEYDDDSVPNLDFIADQLCLSSSDKRTIAVMHAAPMSDQLGENSSMAMHSELKRFDNLMFCLNAHGHSTSVTDYFDDGILYYQCASAKARSFLLFNITKEGYSYEEIFF